MLKARLNLDAVLVEGPRGVFEVSVDQQVVTGKNPGFPTEDEIVSAVEEALERPAP